jgi:hypothetical protein
MPTGDHPFQRLVDEALKSFAEDLRVSSWRGKENDCINRFAHGHLLSHCGTGVLRHPTQVGIEVGVPQPPGVGTRGAARKDLVIWPEPWMCTWNSEWKPVHIPTVVMEWKICHAKKRLTGHKHDQKWIKAFAEWQPAVLGLTVVVDLDARKQRLLVGRYCRAEAEVCWISV